MVGVMPVLRTHKPLRLLGARGIQNPSLRPAFPDNAIRTAGREYDDGVCLFAHGFPWCSLRIHRALLARCQHIKCILKVYPGLYDREEKTRGIVKETGQKWELKTFIAVPDPIWAEGVFWSATGLADVPFRGGIEIGRMEWKLVQAALKAAKQAGVR